MEVPRRLYTTETGEICEEGDPRARFLLSAQGGVISEAEAQRVGLLDYLAQHAGPEAPRPPDVPSDPPDAKMVEQAAVEDKAVAGPAETKADDEPAPEPPPEGGASFPAEPRRGGTRRPPS